MLVKKKGSYGKYFRLDLVKARVLDSRGDILKLSDCRGQDLYCGGDTLK